MNGQQQEDRQLHALLNACGLRVCTREDHHGCPYGDAGLDDCEERLAADHEAMVLRLLGLPETASGESKEKR